tara:strand:+ start:3022 stop:3894 length:873 start_codon:yes stop_codon:yes gene_type:complete
MGGFFRPKTQIVSVPSSSSGSSEVKPYAPVEPFIERLLPQIESEYNQSPELFTGSLVPTDSAQTLAARDSLANLAASGGTLDALGTGMENLYLNRLGTALGDPTQDAVFKAQTGTIADQARLLTEGDKQTAQQQAIEAGQFGLGSTSLAELQELQRQKREETTQRQLSTALGQAEARRLQAAVEIPGLTRGVAGAAVSPAILQSQIGSDIEARESAQLADQARLAQQGQEARRLGLITKSNLLSGLAGLGSQTAYQGTSTTGQAFQQPSGFSQLASAAGTLLPILGGGIG